MGSAKVTNAIPQPPMAENDKKTLKKLFKVLFKKDKKKEKLPEDNAIKTEKKREIQQNHIAVNTVANILDKIKKLEIKDDVDDDDEFKHFSRKIVEEEPRNDRIDSQSSEDSGFVEKYVEDVTDDESKEKDDVVISLKNLNLSEDDGDIRSNEKDEKIADALKKLDINIDKTHITKESSKEEEKSVVSIRDEETNEISNKEDIKTAVSNKDDEKCAKEKRVQTVVISRGPVKTKLVEVKNSSPYYVPQSDLCRQVQINKNTLTGGQVIVNQSRHNDSTEFDNALKLVQQTSQNSQHEYGDEWINIVSDVIESDLNKVPQGNSENFLNKVPQEESYVNFPNNVPQEESEDLLSCFFQSQQLQPVPVSVMTPPHQETPPNPIEEFSNHLNYELFGDLDFTSLMPEAQALPTPKNQFVYPTPPRSENAASPMSDSQSSFRTSEYVYSPDRSVILSPERSSPICNGDFEKFQEIPHYEDSPVPDDDKAKPRERVNSVSSMTMKQYKDLQKQLSLSFSKKDCCQITLKPCKEMFQEYLKKLKMDERKSLCFKVAKMDLKNAYGVLQNALITLSQSSEQEELLHALFCLLCERVLSQMPAWFAGDFGLNLLKSAVLRCPQRPLLTRYLVQCVRTAIRVNPDLVQGKDSVFHEVDAQGDTLVTACARRGDLCADVLGELVRREKASQLPLFRIHHVNADGASALHVACIEHSATSPRTHIAHVLLEHAGADLWQGDAKAGDTAVHMAVNSKHCDLNLIMILFRHVDRKVWKKLAHAPNMSSTTPLEYARSATKSQIRDGYPSEVLEFLKKCR